MRSLIAAMVLLLVGALSARADGNLTAGQLGQMCAMSATAAQHERDIADSICAAFLLGLTGGMYVMQQLADRAQSPCMPKEGSLRIPEAKGLFENYLRSHPNFAGNSAGLIAALAIANAFSCTPTK